MKLLKRLLLLIFIVACGFITIAYSWTFTPQGRLDIAAAVIAKFSELSADPLVLDPERIEILRNQANDQMGAALRLVPVTDAVTISDISIPGPGGAIRLRKYIPTHEGELPAMLWIHGGGFWMGNQLEDWDGRVAAMAADAGVAIFSVDYRLAPEHPWPAAVDDCYAALLWLYDHPKAQGLDANYIAVGGSSAGGNLAAAITLRAREENGPAIVAQLLTVPATDASDTVYESDQLFAEGYVLTSQNIEAMIGAYLPNAADRLEPTASPLLASSHKDLPPALIITAQYDPLRDEGEAYGKKLQAAGVPVEMIRYDGAVHGLMGSFESMRDAHLAHVKFLKAAFSTNE